MSRLRGLEAAGLVVLLFAFVMTGLWLSSQTSLEEYVVPQPEQVAEQLISALAARRYAGVEPVLSNELRDATTLDDLRALADRVEARTWDIGEIEGDESAKQGNQASALVSVRLTDGREQRIDLPLRKEQGVWRVTALAPLERLAQ